ncbi:MAG: hypothetical protein FWF97_04830 [Alphaproteobacteria bacterium]|nr:hypothetical protein [Alphaproteobacteria bacterium]
MRYLKLLLLSLSLLLVMPVAHSAQIANVEYVHKYLETQTGLNIPIKVEAEKKHAVNVEYVLYMIDRANQLLTRTTTNYYGLNVSNRKHAADTIAVHNAIDELIVTPAFTVTLTGMASSSIYSTFSFDISASGNFTIDWGDKKPGSVQKITKTDTTNTTYSHTYASAGNYTVKITGRATGYNPDENIAAISFAKSCSSGKSTINNITALSGSIGAIFPILNDTPTGRPRFIRTFSGLNNLVSIPEELFSEIQGGTEPYGPTSRMFDHTFACCTESNSNFGSIEGGNLRGVIPGELFSEIQGAPAKWMFHGTFEGCSKLTGIGGPLFAGIRGVPAEGMFARTFHSCRGLTGVGPDGTGTIPRGLFGHFDNGAPAPHMFASTFQGCRNLCGEIPGNLFQGMKGRPATGMFFNTFKYSFTMAELAVKGDPCYDLATVQMVYIYPNYYPCRSNIGAGLFDGIEGIEDKVVCTERNFGSPAYSRQIIDCDNSPGWKSPYVALGMFGGTFANVSLCGDGPTSDGVYLWEKFPGNCLGKSGGTPTTQLPFGCFFAPAGNIGGGANYNSVFHIKLSGRDGENDCTCSNGIMSTCSKFPGDNYPYTYNAFSATVYAVKGGVMCDSALADPKLY